MKVLIFALVASRQKRSSPYNELKVIRKIALNSPVRVLEVVLMKIPSLLRFYAASPSKQLPTFRRNQVPSFTGSGTVNKNSNFFNQPRNHDLLFESSASLNQNKLDFNITNVLYRCTVHSVVYLLTQTNTCIYIYIYIYNLRSLKFTLKHLKRS